MQVGIGGERDYQSPQGRSLAQGPQVTRGIDSQCPPVAQIRQVGRVAQAFVDQWDQLVTGVTHQSSTSNKPRSPILQYSKLYWKSELAKPGRTTCIWVARPREGAPCNG